MKKFNKYIFLVLTILFIVIFSCCQRKSTNKQEIQDNKYNTSNNIYNYTLTKTEEIKKLLAKHNRENSELRDRYGTNNLEYKNALLFLIERQQKELTDFLYDINSVLMALKPKNNIEGYFVCDLYLQLIEFDYYNILRYIGIKSNSNCFFQTARELLLLIKKEDAADLKTLTDLQRIRVDMSTASLIDKNKSYNQNNSKTFSKIYLKTHRTYIMNLENKFNLFINDNNQHLYSENDTTIINLYHPYFTDYLVQKIDFEKTIANSNINDDDTKTMIDIARVELDASFFYFLLSYNYGLLKENDRINLINCSIDNRKIQIRCLNELINRK
jgi:hypothetical protein